MEQISFLSQLQNPSGFWILDSRNKSNLKLVWILKGSKPFGKNPINSQKIFLDMIFNTMNLDWLTCIQILEVSLQVVKMTVKFILKIAGHLGMLGSLPQLHNWSKIGNECSKWRYRYCSLIMFICINYLLNSKKICNFQKW